MWKVYRVAAFAQQPGNSKKYWPINFSIREETDIIDLDFRDVLLAIGSRLFREYRKKGGVLPDQLLKELNGWKGKVEKQISTILDGRVSEYELGASIDTFFVNAGLKMKLEPATRVELRQVVETDITGLIAIINHIAAAIYHQEKRIPLILIDDMDKPDLDRARAIFHDRREIMMQPNCAIVYTVSEALIVSIDSDYIREKAIILKEIDIKINDNYKIMEQFIAKRMILDLVDQKALYKAISFSGGNFREMARIMRVAIGSARRRKSSKVEIADIQIARNNTEISFNMKESNSSSFDNTNVESSSSDGLNAKNDDLRVHQVATQELELVRQIEPKTEEDRKASENNRSKTIRRLKVFLCHSSSDKPAIRELYQKLGTVSWIDVWLDEEKLLPGQDWEYEIENALDKADAVIVSLSRRSVTKEGYVQRELRFVIDIALEKPEGTIFILPVRLEECEPPRKLRPYQYADYFPPEQRERAFQRLLASLRMRAEDLRIPAEV